MHTALMGELQHPRARSGVEVDSNSLFIGSDSRFKFEKCYRKSAVGRRKTCASVRQSSSCFLKQFFL